MAIGVAIPLSLLSIVLLWRRWRSSLPQWIALSYSIIVIGLAAGHLACSCILTFGRSSEAVTIAKTVTYDLCLWLSDSFLVCIPFHKSTIQLLTGIQLYRAFGIYRGQRLWLVLPGIAICASVGKLIKVTTLHNSHCIRQCAVS
jgi:hypothetical protein